MKTLLQVIKTAWKWRSEAVRIGMLALIVPRPSKITLMVASLVSRLSHM